MRYDESEMEKWRYDRQQKFLDELAAKLGVVTYRPDYHGSKGDCNTVLFYTKEDAEHNRKVDKQPTKYSKGEADDWAKYHGVYIEEKYIYRNYFFDFANTDINGRFSWDFANWGRLDLRGLKWQEVIEGAVRLALAIKNQVDHLNATGGLGALREADDVYNDLTREKLKAFHMMHPNAVLGEINFYGEQNKQVVAGTMSVYGEYFGGNVPTFGCSFIIPQADVELEKMIRAWNGQKLPLDIGLMDRIMQRITWLKGMNVNWY